MSSSIDFLPSVYDAQQRIFQTRANVGRYSKFWTSSIDYRAFKLSHTVTSYAQFAS